MQKSFNLKLIFPHCLALLLLVTGGSVQATETVKRTAIVLNSGEASVSLIDMDKRAVYKTFAVGKEPHH